MSYESDQLDAYDGAEAERFLIGSIKKPAADPMEKPEPEIMGVPLSKAQEAGETVKEELKSAAYNVGLGGVVDAANVGMETGSDLLEAGFAGPANMLINREMQLTVPPSRFEKIPMPEGFIGQLARAFVQFGAGMAATPGAGASTPLRLAIKSGLAEGAYFDPKEGGFIRPLIDIGILPEAVEFLAVEPSEEDGVIGRLKSRAGLGVQGGAVGLAFDGIIATLKLIKNSPKALRLATNTIATALGATALLPKDAEGSPIKTLFTRLTKAENQAITRDATKDGVVDKKLVKAVKEKVLATKNQFPPSDGWLPIGVNPEGTTPSFTINKKGKITLKWSQPAYAFHVPKGNKKLSTHKTELTNKTVDDVNAVLKRAQSGDQAAIDIINQANWYRSMRTRLRREFGGLGDVFADILGATSAQTNVQVNYESALGVLRRFTKGEFDEEIELYKKMLESGEPKGPNLFRKDKAKDDPFKLIRKETGALFQSNSPAATEALLDMFRQVKEGAKPKTINFTGNLIGFGNEATIDVWAARYLRDAAGLPRIPPPAEKAVAGEHLKDSTFDNPLIGGEFGFGQEVFSDAAGILNSQGGIKAFDPDLGDLGPDDLQAIIWFLEKEKWTKNGWTTKAGEGGSLDYESVFGGSPDRPRVAELRSVINADFKPPKKRIKETDEEYAERLKEAEATDLQTKNDARAELKTLEGEPQRFTAGISRERPDDIPTNIQQNELAQEVLAPVVKDPKTIGVQATPSIGGFAGIRERNLNFEVVAQTDFDPTDMTNAIVEAGVKYDQDAVFVSKVVPDGTANARPGVEVYFRDRQGVNFAERILKILQDKGVDGFTFVTDTRQADRPSVQALGDEPTSALVGIRFQYIPEFDDAFDASRQQDIFDEKADLFRSVINDMGEIDGITYADVVYYDTTVYVNRGRSGTEWINGGTSYEEYLGSSAGKGAERVGGQGNLFGEAAP